MMSEPMDADTQVRIFKDAGLKVVERKGWRTHNRAGHGAYGPLNGVIMHHTGSDSSAASMEAYLYDGDSERNLPGPLCQWSIRTDGTIVMIGNGRANHAGEGSGTVLAHVIAEDYSGDLRPGPDDTDGNAHFMGFETQYSGGHVPVKAQYDAMVKAAAAVCKHYGWSAKSVIGHKEWTSRKNDPGHVDMSDFRKDVQAILDYTKPVPAPAPAPKPKPKPVDPAFTKALSSKVAPGGHDPQVADLQRLLTLAGYGPIPGTPPYTQFYGANTEEAVARFHAANPQYASRSHDVAIGPRGYAALQKLALAAKRG